MKTINFKKEISGNLLNPLNRDALIERVSSAFKKEGFGVLTRIDFHDKMKEKLGKEIPPAIVLGTCHPQTAFAAYEFNADFLSLIPCNTVLRQIGADRVSVEVIKPSLMMKMVVGEKLPSEMVGMANDIDGKVERALSSI